MSKNNKKTYSNKKYTGIFDFYEGLDEKNKIPLKKKSSGSKTSKQKKRVIELCNKTEHTEDINNTESISLNVTTNQASNDVIKSFVDAKHFLENHKITISTITLDCKLHTSINVDKFAKNVILREDEIVSVKYGNRNDPATNRTIVIIKSKKKPSIKNFYNQVTILMKPTNNPDRNYINIKVFKNGSLQMTGCKDMDDFSNVTNTLIKILKRGRDIKNKQGKTIHINFVDGPDKIGIFDTKIRMINSNFRLDYKVDRKKLAKLLKKNHGKYTKDTEIGHVEFKYKPNGGHSCVNIKYKYDDINKPSIFVFQTGAVIITGAKNLHHIIMSYRYIQKILNKYYDLIKIVDLDYKKVKAEIINFLKNKKTIMEQKKKKILDDKKNSTNKPKRLSFLQT